MFRRTLQLLFCLFALLCFSSCGYYHLGGLKAGNMRNMNTFSVEMFENTTVYPMAGVQMTNALVDSLQCDGTFRLASPSTCDFVISGRVANVEASAMRTSSSDTYVSDEVRLQVTVDCRVVNRKTGKLIMHREVHESASCFNELGNVQSAREDAVSAAIRKVADRMIEYFTMP